MNTQEREVMDALAKALREYVEHGRRAWQPPLFGASDAISAYDALLSSSAAGEKCFCDTKYPDSSPHATCGDCPRDYKGSAAGEQAEAVAWLRTDAGKAYMELCRPQPAQGEQCSALEVFRIAGGDTECTPNPTAAVAIDCLRDLRECYDEALSEANRRESQRSSEGSDRRPIADEVVANAVRAYWRAWPQSTNCDADDRHISGIRAALESALPRGLPAGSVAALWPECHGCGSPLLMENLFVDDGCPCNSPRGVNLTPKSCGICGTDNCVKPGHRIGDLFGLTVATAEQPSCGQDARDAEKLLRDLLRHVDGETCRHEETHRGGSIWTICDQCSRKWADDQGGFEPYQDAPAVAAAREYCDRIDAAIAAQQRQGGGS